MNEAQARANSNIAFIKYWGNRDEALRLPVNPSLSMNIDGFHTETRVRWDKSLSSDQLILNGKRAKNDVLQRVVKHLNVIRKMADIEIFAQVQSVNTFPMGAGIASSASAFAALSLAATAAAGLELSERELTTLARMGSGSASRSIPSGFVEWHMGDSHETSYAETFAPADYWDLVDVIAIISQEHKAVTSQRGHITAATSDLQDARVAGASERFAICRQAVLDRDFPTFAEVVEMDSNLMHAVMMTSRPALFYWEPSSLLVMKSVRQWRDEGVDVCYTMDAGPNVHCLCSSQDVDIVVGKLGAIEGVNSVRWAKVGEGVKLTRRT